jgi:predicted component of type VI protein secretion system
MAKTVTFQIVDGVDKGRIYGDLPVPVSIGREEGNVLRLNDERVSRFHAKILIDDNDIVLTDLDSTNGTRVNGTTIQIRRLRIGDRIGIGRSVLIYGSNHEIASRMKELAGAPSVTANTELRDDPPDGEIRTVYGKVDSNIDFDVDVTAPIKVTKDTVLIGTQELPALPQKLTPAQAARLSEILDYLHAGLNQATESILAKDDGTQVIMPFDAWQRVQAVEMLLSRYSRMITEPGE